MPPLVWSAVVVTSTMARSTNIQTPAANGPNSQADGSELVSSGGSRRSMPMRVAMPSTTTVVASAHHHVERTDQRRLHSAAAVRASTTAVLGPGDRDVAVLIGWLRSHGL
jgi:hypothetical protein